MADKKFKLVCVIDIGSTYTGFAYTWTRAPTDIKFNEEWGVGLGLNSYKTASSVLLNKSGELEEFGYDAEYKYSMLCGLGDTDGLELYTSFKHQLHGNKSLSRDLKVKSENGVEKTAIVLFKLTLKFIKQTLIKQLRSEKPDSSEVLWVMTVPSSCDDVTRDFCRDAALQAGLIDRLTSPQCVFVSESAAAALYCRSLDSTKLTSSKPDSEMTFSVGSQFMVIDAGGTMKVTTHEVKQTGDMEEVSTPVSDPHGGHTVNTQFYKLLCRIFGDNFIDSYRDKNLDFWFQHVDVMFEKKKREFVPEASSGISLPLKSRIEKQHKKDTGDDIEDIIGKYNQMHISARNNDIVIYREAISELHEEVFKFILPKIEAVLRNQLLRGLKHIFVLGSFAESEILRLKLVERFPKYVILVPESVSTAVLRGAMLSVYNPHQASPQKPLQESDRRDYQYVCAIDFGTTYSGYAYYKENDKVKEVKASIIEDIKMNKAWDNPMGLDTFKTSTSVLINPRGDMDAFGFIAEYKYGQMCAKDEAEGVNLFRRFKMVLHNEKDLTRKTMVESTTGVMRPAIDIFSMALCYMKDHFMEAVREEEGSLPDLPKVRWVITVPAIWSDKAKQFMREAAHQAGLIDKQSSRQLMFALEPEAAALYCQQLQLDRFRAFTTLDTTAIDFSEGSKFMVIDAGGGTVDISVQQVLSRGNIKLLLAPSGGGWGGNYLNLEIEEIMKIVFGEEFIKLYQKEFPEDWLELEMTFEKQKRSHTPNGKCEVSLAIPSSFDRYHEEVTDNRVKNVVAKFEDMGVTVTKKFRLVINPTKVLDLYQKIITKVIPHVTDLLKDPKLHDLKHIFLVGGFSESDFLKKAIGEAFFNYVILTPEHSGTAVIRGAVLYGHRPDTVTARIAKKTYGCSMNMPFIEGKHDPKKKVLDEFGKPFCRGVFERYISENDEIKVGECKTFVSYPFSSKSTHILKPLLVSDQKDSKYADDQGVRKVGEMKIPMINTKGGVNRKIETRVYFGGTEITVESRDAREGGQVIQAMLNFMCDPKLT